MLALTFTTLANQAARLRPALRKLRAVVDDPSAGQPRESLAKVITLVFVPFAIGYYLSYFFRCTNAIIAPQLTSEFGLDAGDLGLLTAMYFLTFAAFQLPLGVLLDRYGPRRVQSLLLLFAAAGAILFASGQTIEALALGRGLIGLGVAGCLMASLKAGTMWFDQRHWPTVNGCYLAIGGLGAVSATAPLEAALGFIDWRTVFLILAGVTVAIAALIFVTVPEHRNDAPVPKLGKQIRELGQIFVNLGFWRCAPLTITSMAANMSIQGLWAGPWLKDVAGFGRDGVAETLLVLALALAGGSVVLGVLASWLEGFGISLLTFFGICAGIFISFQAAIVFELMPQALWPWVGFGLFSNIAMFTFAYITRYFPKELSGRAITSMNTLIFTGVFLVQYLMGEVIDLWPIDASGGYHHEAYFAAFGVVLIAQIISFIWFLLAGRLQSRRG